MVRIALTLFAVLAVVSPGAVAAEPDPFAIDVKPFLQAHCVKCHGVAKAAGDVRLDDLTADAGPHADRWAAIRGQIRHGLMPPAKEARPDAKQTQQIIAWIEAELTRVGKSVARPQPQYGNDVPHAPLFDPANAKIPASTPARYWRLSPFIYRQFMTRQHPSGNNLVSPFNLLPGNGFKDYALPLAIDEPTAVLLWINAESLVNFRLRIDPKTGKLDKPQYKEMGEVFDEAVPLTDAKLTQVVTEEFKRVLGRSPTLSERTRWVGLLNANIAAGGRATGVRMTVAALYLHPEVVYRKEIGEGPTEAHGRRRLSPWELSFAIAYALGDKRPDSELLRAADAGKLATREDVTREVNRLLDDPKFEKPRIMRFFHEYFGYPAAINVFKDAKPFYPSQAIRDTDALVAHILETDTQVIAQLLGTDMVFVGKHHTDPNERPYLMYGLTALPDGAAKRPVPVTLPPGQRAGVLTQPSWLIAHSTNFDNHPIARGHWIREKLLGGTLPEIPLNVDAKLPDDKDQTLRQRMHVTRVEYCWKCHQKMDPLGLPFEMFSHTGLYRQVETVLDPNTPPSPKKRAPATRDLPLDSSGAIEGTSEATVDGPVRDAVEMMKRMAGSTHVEQVIIRHMFRYWMGRNENLSDASTLQNAHKAYKESGGSFRAALISLLTSDSFLYRTGDRPQAPVVPR